MRSSGLWEARLDPHHCPSPSFHPPEDKSSMPDPPVVLASDVALRRSGIRLAPKKPLFGPEHKGFSQRVLHQGLGLRFCENALAEENNRCPSSSAR